jgi:hypothetical protein
LGYGARQLGVDQLARRTVLLRTYTLEGTAGQHDPYVIAAIVSWMVPGKRNLAHLYSGIFAASDAQRANCVNSLPGCVS